MLKKSVFLLLLSLLAMMSHAKLPVDYLEAKLNAMQTFQANFTQVVHSSRGRIIQRGAGSVALTRKRQFRWEMDRPIKQVIVTNGRRLWIYDRDLKQVTVSKLRLSFAPTAALFLSDDTRFLGRDYAISMSAAATYFKLKPKGGRYTFKSVELWFKKGLSSMRLIDKLGQAITYTFKRTRVNRRLNPALFQFKPPRGVDVVNG